MTPVGVALIVGGITTLIVFRRILFEASGPERRRGTTERGRQRRASRRTPAEPSPGARDRPTPAEPGPRDRRTPAGPSQGPRSRRRGATRPHRDSATPPAARPAPASNAQLDLPQRPAMGTQLDLPQRTAVGTPLDLPKRPAMSAPLDLPKRTPMNAQRNPPGMNAQRNPPGLNTRPRPAAMIDVNQRMRPLDAAPARLPDAETLHAPGRIVRERLNVERSTGTRVDRNAEGRDRWPLNTRSEPDDAAAIRPWRPEEKKQDDQPRYGDRVDGWVRPEYRDEPVTGDYWTPAPDAGYGWPVPVERLPQVPPPVAPAQPEAEAEPTAMLPLDWRPRSTEPMSPLPQRVPVEPQPVAGPLAGRPESVEGPLAGRPESVAGPLAGRPESVEGPIWTVPDLPEAALPDLSWAPQREELPRRQLRMRRQRAGEQRPRPRPSPRPRPGADPVEPADPRSTVYRSRHAAEPT